jgi:hypothetical protein
MNPLSVTRREKAGMREAAGALVLRGMGGDGGGGTASRLARHVVRSDGESSVILLFLQEVRDAIRYDGCEFAVP